MKNLKSKIASILSVSLLGTSLIVPSVFADETTEEQAVTTYKTAYEQDFTEQGLTKDILKSQGWTIGSSFGFDTNGLGGYHNTSEQYATYDADAGSNYKLSGQLYVSYGKNGMICDIAKDSAGKAVSITFKETQKSVLSCNGSDVTFDMTIDRNTTYTYTFECNDKKVTATLSNGTKTETKSLELDSQIMPYVRWIMKSYSDMKLKSMKLEVPSNYPLYNKTVYEQDFKQAGLTVGDVTSDGWVINSMTPSTGNGLNGAYDSSAIYTGDLGTKYKVSGSFEFAANSVKFCYGGTVKDGAYSGEKPITMHKSNASSSTLDGDGMNVTFPQYEVLNYEFTCNENVVTFLVKKSDGTVLVNQSKKYDSPLESNCIRWYSDAGYVSYVRLYDIKIKVADDYKEYVTTYNRTFTYSTDEAPYTEDEIKAEGWVYSDIMSPTKDGLYASSEEKAHAYAWYNKDLGTEYIADLVMTRNYYGSERYFFNATLDSTYGVVSGFAVENDKDYGTSPIKLYKYVDGVSTLVAESDVPLGGICPLSIHIEYDNGKIFVKETKSSGSATITYDATKDIAANPELASGIIGGKSSRALQFGTVDSYFYAVRSLTVQQPDTENKLSTLIVNVADDNTVTYSVKGNNKTSEKLDAIIIVAAYDVNGQLLGVDISGQYIGSLGVQAVTGTFACPEAPANVKAFLIDGFKNLRPLASAISKTIE